MRVARVAGLEVCVVNRFGQLKSALHTALSFKNPEHSPLQKPFKIVLNHMIPKVVEALPLIAEAPCPQSLLLQIKLPSRFELQRDTLDQALEENPARPDF